MDEEDALRRLWTEVFGEPPSITAPSALMAQILVESLPPAEPYRPRPSPSAGEPCRVYRRDDSG